MLFQSLIDDTLKRKDSEGILRWSRTSLTMFTAWVASLFAFFLDAIKHQGDVNGAMFSVMVGVALGSKVTDAWSRKLTQQDGSDSIAK